MTMMMRKKEDDDDDDIHEEKPTIFQKNMDPEYTSSNQDHCYDDKNNEETFPISATMLFDSKPQKMELMESNQDIKIPSYAIAAGDDVTEINYSTKSSSSSLSNLMDGANASADNQKTTTLSDDSSVEEHFYWFDDYNENSSFWAQLSALEQIIQPH
ncbi:OLC1v1012873C2 [Oldenlandia corymbosa var. corymbosa]|nr:OLC1v1012873C2 [Oldenlandia corymbosa var. corymbosa]